MCFQTARHVLSSQQFIAGIRYVHSLHSRMQLHSTVIRLGFALALTLSMAWSATAQVSIPEAITPYLNGNYQVAIQQLNKAIPEGSRKNKPLGYFHLGMSYYKLATDPEQGAAAGYDVDKLIGKAEKAFLAGIDRDKRYGYNYAGRGLVKVQRGKVESAKQDFQLAIEQAPEDVDLLIILAAAYVELYENKDIDKSVRDEAISEATTLLTRADAIKENSPDVAIALGKVWEAQGIQESARSNYKRAVELQGSNPRAVYNLGRLQVDMGEYQVGQDNLIKAKDLDPDFAPTYKELADLYFKAQEYGAAKKELEAYRDKLVEQGGDATYANVRYAQALYLIKKYDDAVVALKDVMKDSTNFVLQRLLSYSLAETEQWGEAKPAIDEFFSMAPEDMVIAKDYAYKGRIYYNSGDLDGAIKAYDKAIEMEAPVKGMYKDLYEIYKEKKEYRKANEYYEKEYEQSGSLTDLFYIGFNYYKYVKDYEKADEKLAEVIEKVPSLEDAYYYRARARIAAETKDSTKSGYAEPVVIELLDKIDAQLENGEIKEKKAQTHRKVAYGYLAVRYYKSERDGKAKFVLQKLEEINPESAYVEQLLPALRDVEPVDIHAEEEDEDEDDTDE